VVVSDYWFNEPQFISCQQQEFYASGLFADACWVQPLPGFTLTVETLQIPANDELNRVKWGYADDTGYLTGGPFDATSFDPLVYAYYDVPRLGFNDANINQRGVQFPSFVPAPQINGGYELTQFGFTG